MADPITYADAGVDIDKANTLVSVISRITKHTKRSGVIGEIGGFAGLFSIERVIADMKHPVLVSSTDGVGTKLNIAFMLNKHDTIGIDLVAMCVNDILVQGAKPLFLLDYLAMGRLDNDCAAAHHHCHLKSDRQPEEDQADIQIRTATGEVRWLHHVCRPVFDGDGVYLGRRASNYDITEEKLVVKLQKEELIDKFREALENVKTLSGFLPICASCKKIRDDRGYWNQIETYISEHSETVFSHGICPDCARKLYPGFYRPGDNGADGPPAPGDK